MCPAPTCRRQCTPPSSATASWSPPSPAAPRDRPGALKIPFFHNNVDYDEVIFYHAGDFFSRDHIEAGDDDVPPLRLHPRAAPEGAEEHAEPAQARHRRNTP